MLKQRYLVFDRNKLEAFEDAHRSMTDADIHQEIIKPQPTLPCLARLNVRINRPQRDFAKWEFVVTRELAQPGEDPRGRNSGTPNEILYISSGYSDENVATVTDITNTGPLEGKGINSWLLDLALEHFMAFSGPDPWLKGRLTSVDRDNPRRVPFWNRHLRDPVIVHTSGEGSFLSPWVKAYNPYRTTAVAILEHQEGEALTSKTP